MTKHSPSRRDFLKSAGIGLSALVIGVPLGANEVIRAQASPKDGVAGATEAELPTDSFAPSMWLAILPTGDVKIWAHRSEMGTGIRTSLPMVVADELEADWERVEIVQGLGDADFGSQNTDGSRSVRRFYQAMRVAGASARAMLEQAAAAKWDVAPKGCRAELHHVVGPDGKKLSFSELVVDASKLDAPKESDLRFKKKRERRYVGQDSVKSYDTHAMITGQADYGADVQFKDLVYAVIARPSTLNGSLKDIDTSDTLAVPGVIKTIELKKWGGPGPGFQPLGGIAVIANSTHAAIKGRDQLSYDEDFGGDQEFSSIELSKTLLAEVQKSGKVIRESGDVGKAMAQAASQHQAQYTVPFLSHAPMEPPVATARWDGKKCEIWAPTQNPQAVQQTIAQLHGVPVTNVKVNVTFLGGGFGRKSKADFSAEAAYLSKEMGGAPVRVQWTREDDLRFDYYHTSTVEHVEAGLDKNGLPEAWIQRSAFPSISSTFNRRSQGGGGFELDLGFTDMMWQVPNLRMEVGKGTAPTRIGWLRSVNHIPHAFAEGSFADELAAKAGEDRVEYLHKLIGADRKIDFTKELKNNTNYGNHGEPLSRYPIDTKRLKKVLDLVAEESGWGRRMGKGRGMGICVHRSFLSYVACAVEVRVTRRGELSINRIDIGIDCGLAINPDRVRAQLEGSAIFGATLALYGEISFNGGVVEQGNFDTYKMLRMREAPKELHTYIVESEELPSGVGEPGTPPVAPAIANAIFAATGKRIRELPIMNHDLSW